MHRHACVRDAHPHLSRSLALAACLVSVALPGCGQGASASDTGDAEVQRNLKAVAGVPQDGITLGRVDAPATLTVFASLDDFSQGFFRGELPVIVSRWVRPGRLRIQLRTTSKTVLGAPSDRGAVVAAKVAQAVGLQDHLWQFYGALSARYVGYLDDAVLSQALSDVKGVDRGAEHRDVGSDRIRNAVDKADRFARAAKVSELPTYVLEVPGRAPIRLDASCLGCLSKSLARYLAA